MCDDARTWSVAVLCRDTLTAFIAGADVPLSQILTQSHTWTSSHTRQPTLLSPEL